MKKLSTAILVAGIALSVTGCETTTDSKGVVTKRVDWNGVATGASIAMNTVRDYKAIKELRD